MLEIKPLSEKNMFYLLIVYNFRFKEGKSLFTSLFKVSIIDTSNTYIAKKDWAARGA